VSSLFDRNSEESPTARPVAQRRIRRSARTSHPAGRERRVTVNDPNEKTLADQIARCEGALTAKRLSQYLSIAPVTLFKLAQRGAIPSFRVGTCVRFCPAAIARWLRERGG